MKKLIAVIGVLMISMLATGCTSVKPDVGHEAVLVMKPMFFGHGGVDDTPIKTGRSFVALTTDAVEVNVQPLQIKEHFDDLMTSDGVPIDFDPTLGVRITDSVKMIKTFGEKWYENNLQAEYRERVRQAVKKHGMNETAISDTATVEIDNEVTDQVKKLITSIGLPLEFIRFTIGKANPPDSIKDQRIATAAQQQRVKTEEQRKLAEDSRKLAEQSRAEADNAFRNAMQMSPEQYLRLEEIKMKRDICANGHCTVFMGSGATPIINTK
jgi:regulator of protease activity HflC (stomatin/prohibitin superfamily)